MGAILRDRRERAGLSQEAFAEAAGVHRTYVGGVERGERNISFLTLARFMRAAGITWSEFAAEFEERS
jgi:transcriptional regulator with XRE-family HTH domain